MYTSGRRYARKYVKEYLQKNFVIPFRVSRGEALSQLVNPHDEGHGDGAKRSSDYIDNTGILGLVIKKGGHADAGSGRGRGRCQQRDEQNRLTIR